MKLKAKLLLSSGLPIVILLVISLIIAITITKMTKTTQMVEHTYKVIDASDELVAAMVDQETGLRGYAVGGQEDYLEPYYGGLEKFNENMAEVTELVSDNPAQVERFAGIAEDAALWKEYSVKMIDLRKDIASGETIHTELIELVRSGIGKEKMDGTRAILASISEKGRTESLHADKILMDMVNMETGLRGFLFNSNDDFLEPYINGKESINGSINTLASTGVNTAQLKSAVELWINEYAEKAIALNQADMETESMESLYEQFALKEGKTHMDALRVAINEVVSIEEGLMDERQASAEQAVSLTWVVIIVGGILSIIVGIFSTFIASIIARPIQEMAVIAEKVANGDLTQTSDAKSNDEVGLLATSLNKMVSNLRDMIGNIKATTDTVAASAAELSSVSTQMKSGAENMIAQSTTVASTTEEMSININDMAAAAEEMSVNANEVAGAAEQMSVNINSVSSSVEQMTVSLNNVSNDANKARDISNKAVASANSATGTMNILGESAREIGNVTEVIKRIAEQTNLLALNATIEAAGAGEAGKGFAVVANEIKELANQSAQAADDITKRIEGVQTNTGTAVEVINEVSEVINEIGTSVTSIAIAVEEQSKAANEISSNVLQASSGATNIANSISEVAKGTSDVSNNSGEAAKGANDVSSSIGTVQKVAEDTGSGAKQINVSSEELAQLSGELQHMVSKFIIS